MPKKNLTSANGRVMSEKNDRPFEKFQPKPSGKYASANHHHELTARHKLVRIGGSEFVANVDAIPLLTALDNVGLKTRSHHIDGSGPAFIAIMLDNASVEIQRVNEGRSGRTEFNGKYEMLIRWAPDQE